MGLSYFDGSVEEEKYSERRKSLAPLLGRGIEFFSVSSIHLFIGIDYFFAPDLHNARKGSSYRSNSTFYNSGISLNW